MIQEIKYMLFMVLVLLMPESVVADIKYNYWIDSDFEHIITSSSCITTIDCSRLDVGFHTVNIFAENDKGISPIIKKFFYREENTDSKIEYRYWIDDDFASSKSSTTPLANIDCANLSTGFHRLNIIAKEAERYSPVKSKFFYKTRKLLEEGSFVVLIDGNYHSSYNAKTDGLIPIEVDLYDLAEGKHKFEAFFTYPDGTSSLMESAEFESVGLQEKNSIEVVITDKRDNEVTDSVDLIWRNDDGNMINKGAKLSGLTTGQSLFLDVVLSEELGREYKEIRRKEFIVTESPIFDTIVLKSFDSNVFRINGHVLDEDFPLSGVNIDAIQYKNGVYTDTIRMTSDDNGIFSYDSMVEAPTIFALRKKGYISNSILIDSLSPTNATGLEFKMKPIGEKKISLELYLDKSTDLGPESTSTLPFDLSQIYFTLKYKDGGTVISEGCLSDSWILLPREISENNILELTLSSPSNLFEEFKTTIVSNEDDILSVVVNLKEYGSLICKKESSSYSGGSTAYVYGANGDLRSYAPFVGDKVKFDNLQDGSYKIVSIASKASPGILSHIDSFGAIGLSEKSDYILSDANISKGLISVIDVGLIPDSKVAPPSASSIISNSWFSVDKVNTIPGEFVRAELRLNIPEEIISEIKEATISIDIPSGCQYISGSLTANRVAIPVSESGQTIKVSLSKDNINSGIRFCVVPVEPGLFHLNSFVSMSIGKPMSMLAGSAVFLSGGYDLDVPAYTAFTKINVNGTASPFADVTIYDGEYEVGRTKADGFGKWRTSVDLNESSNSSKHSIWTKAMEKNGVEIRSLVKTCEYDPNAIAPKTVTMLNNYNKVVFYLDNSGKTRGGYTPSGNSFSFLIDFTENDPEKISNVQLVAYTESNSSIILPADFDSKSGKWYVEHTFKGNNLPVNVDVLYSFNRSLTPDYTDLEKAEKELDDDLKSFDKIDILLGKVDELLEKPDDELDEDMIFSTLYAIDRELGTHVEYEDPPIRYFDGHEFDGIDNPEDFIKKYEELEKRIPYPDVPDNIEDFLKEMLNPESVSTPITVNTGVGVSELLFPPFSQDVESATKQWYVENQEALMTGKGSVVIRNAATGEAIVMSNNFTLPERSPDIPPSQDPAFNDFIGNITSIYDNGPSLFLSEIEVLYPHLSQYYRTLAHQVIILMGTLQNSKIPGIKWHYIRRAADNFKKARCIAIAGKTIGKVGTPFDRVFIGFSTALDISDAKKNWNDWDDIIGHIERDCSGNDRESILNLAKRYKINDQRYIATNKWVKFCTNIAFTFATCRTGGKLGNLKSAAKTAGYVFGIWQAQRLVNEWFDNAYNINRSNSEYNMDCIRRSMKMSSNCKDPYSNPPYPERRHSGGNCLSIRDPSGIVYEGSITKPIEGVTASLFRSDNENESGMGVLWDAENYSQINPMPTDSTGYYGWDVPMGYYQVRFEKEGYQDANSEWLPVPPPQLDVNQSMKKIAPALVEQAHAYSSSVFLGFDTFMSASLLTQNNMIIEDDAGNVSFTIELKDSELYADGEIASRMILKSEKPFTGDKIRLHST